jgi:hypothetical protein
MNAYKLYNQKYYSDVFSYLRKYKRNSRSITNINFVVTSNCYENVEINYYHLCKLMNAIHL